MSQRHELPSTNLAAKILHTGKFQVYIYISVVRVFVFWVIELSRSMVLFLSI